MSTNPRGKPIKRRPWRAPVVEGKPLDMLTFTDLARRLVAYYNKEVQKHHDKVNIFRLKKLTGISYNSLHRYLVLQDRTPTISHMDRIMLALGVSAIELFHNTEKRLWDDEEDKFPRLGNHIYSIDLRCGKLLQAIARRTKEPHTTRMTVLVGGIIRELETICSLYGLGTTFEIRSTKKKVDKPKKVVAINDV